MTDAIAQHALKLRFSGGEAERRGLDLYDGSNSFYGFAQAIQIVVHAYMTGEIVSRATALKGAEIYFGAPRRGSVVFDIITVIEKYPATAGIAGAAFYDFVKVAFSKAVGMLNTKPETPSVQKVDVDDTFFDQLAETLEGSLRRAHRAIDHGVPLVTLERPRSTLVTFDTATSEWVNTRDENPKVEEFSGNITRYNALSGNGRAYVRELKRVIPFRPGGNFPESKRGHLTWSLHGNTISAGKELKLWASKIESARGEPKRLILADVAQVRSTSEE
ncbi:DUF7946 domain-containing protein [Brevundimonas pondensis]|jgi:hypothetical protein|uniref:DUF7946 domain-containing protein n=1 Tax=Brevundimonas pondensis TaxID=2774189 RepID=A0ABX7SJ25_9CAUL|nr:hypothetical protein [Brevundimonas pondensis]QTC87697.1 hypothetical protein IFE19_16745 [Brevundimonas pondensis]